MSKTIRIPGSKSYTNRALLLAALAKGKSTILNPLFSDDTTHMTNALRELGIKITKKGGHLVVNGTGGKFIRPAKPLYLGNAGTAVRFLTAVLAVTGPEALITGDARMRERPIKDLTDALTKLGASIETKNGCPPLKIKKPLTGGKTTVKGNISSQYLSALLMAAPYAKKPVKIQVSGHLTSLPYVKMTLDTMRRFGIKVKNTDFKSFTVSPAAYKPTNFIVEGDASSASYFWAISALNGLKIKVMNIDSSSAQADLGFIGIAEKMGCKVKTGKNFITLTGPKTLKPLGTMNLEHMPDSAMTVAILAAFADGRSTLKGLSTLRVKECDRLTALALELGKIGVPVEEGKDFLTVFGNPDNGNSAVIETYNDHRMAMCFAVAGTKIPGIRISNPDCVNKTYPGFWKDLQSVGIRNTTDIKTARVKKTTGIKTKNIVLGGLRGTGKTFVGKKLAKILKKEFIDTDALIEKNAKMKIAEIVKKYGWPHFRELETKTAQSLIEQKNAVIATGGGMFINPINAAALKKNGAVVLLRCSSSVAASRIRGDENRPALTQQNDAKKELEELWRQRKDSYMAAADFVIDTSAQSDNINSDTTKKANEIIKLINA